VAAILVVPCTRSRPRVAPRSVARTCGDGSRTDLGAVFIKRDVVHPVALGFAAPLVLHVLQERSSARLSGAQIGHARDGLMAVHAGCLGDDRALDLGVLAVRLRRSTCPWRPARARRAA